MKNLEAPKSWREQIMTASQKPLDWTLVATTVEVFGAYKRQGQHLEEVGLIEKAIEELIESPEERERITGQRLRFLMDPKENEQAR